MRGYSVAATALALNANPKWLDNLLSQNCVDGVTQARQGVQRRLAPQAIHIIATAHQLNRDLQVPVVAALRFAHELWRIPSGESSDSAELQIGELALRLNRRQIRERVEGALAEALEMAPRIRRGRPPEKSGRAGP